MILALDYQQSYQIHPELSRTFTFKAKIACFRAGDFKSIEFFENMDVELYNLRKGMRKDRNLASAMPEPNPDYAGDS